MIYGCMQIGGTWDESPVTDAQRATAFAALDAAWGAGIRTYDHADIYCRGKSEAVFGEWLRNRGIERDALTIQSKCGIKLGSPVIYDFSYDHIVHAVDGILERLGIASLDMLLFHRPDPLVDFDGMARAMALLKRDGRVRAFGVSNHSAAQMALLQEASGETLYANQMEISLAHPDLIVAGTAVNQREPDHPMRNDGTLEYCRQHAIELQAWSPLARGVYSGATPESGANTGAVSDTGAITENGAGAPVRETAAYVAELAQRYGVSREAIVLGWLTRHPAGIRPVVGSTSPERIRASVEVAGLDLTREEWYRLTALARGREMP